MRATRTAYLVRPTVSSRSTASSVGGLLVSSYSRTAITCCCSDREHLQKDCRPQALSILSSFARCSTPTQRSATATPRKRKCRYLRGNVGAITNRIAWAASGTHVFARLQSAESRLVVHFNVRMMYEWAPVDPNYSCLRSSSRSSIRSRMSSTECG